MGSLSIRQGIGLALVALVGWILTCIVWLFTQSPLTLLWQSPRDPAILRLLPPQVQTAFVLTAPLAKLQQFTQTLTVASQRRAQRRYWQDWVDGQRTSPWHPYWQAAHINAEREILPWLGSEMALARSGSPDHADYLMALATVDLDASNRFLNLLWQQQDLQQHPLQVETYKGVQVVSFTLPNVGTVATAALGNRYVLLATQPQVIKDSIDGWQRPHESLARDPWFQELLPPSQRGQIGWVIDRGGDPWLGLTTPTVAAVGLSWQGITLDAQMAVPPSAVVVSRRSSLLKHLPATVTAFLAGDTLSNTWPKALHLLPGNLGNPWQEWQAQQSVPWSQVLQGSTEFALALLPTQDRQHPQEWVYVTAIGKKGNSALPTQVATQLSRLGWSATPQSVDGSVASTWARPKDSQTLITYQHHGVFYISASLKTLKAALKGTPPRRFSAHLPIENQGYLYQSLQSWHQKDVILTRLLGDPSSQMPGRVLEKVRGLIHLR